MNNTPRTTKINSSMNKMKVVKAIFCTSILANFLTGCNDPKAANEDNFKKVIVRTLPDTILNCTTTNVRSIDKFEQSRTIDFPLDLGVREELPLLKALTKVGVVSKSEVAIKRPIYNDTIPATRYTLTKDGEKFFKKDLKTFDKSKKINAFCFGEVELDKIVNFTEPTDFFGRTVSEVKYTYRIKNLPSWTSDSQVQALIPAVARMVQTKDKPAEVKAALFLTGNGWVDEL
ncbi:hypothetical protein [Tolypothrix sp. VBCCA 56010]|uniref:hypothetical protein n=1 Tax=Tolypothrix sp. VBCCA 56010 TaxID=3137731 RepID=UPI003D7EA5A9